MARDDLPKSSLSAQGAEPSKSLTINLLLPQIARAMTQNLFRKAA